MPTWARVTVLLLLALAVLWHGLGPLAGYDFWWQMATGRHIALTGEVPRTDPFSHTFADRPWPYHDTLGCLLFYGLFVLAGPAGLVVTKAFVYLGSIALLRRMMCERALPDALQALVLALVVGVVAFRFAERLQIFSFAALVAVLFVLEGHRAGRRSVFWVVPIVLLNVNLHRGALLLPLVLLIHTASLAFVAWQAKTSQRPTLEAGAATLLALVACLVNPFGTAVFGTSVSMVSDPVLHGSIPEWWPITFSNVAQASPATFLFVIVALAALLSWGRRPDPAQLLFLVFAFAIASRGIRFLPYLALMGALPIACALDHADALRSVWRGPRNALVAIGAALAIVAATLSSGLPPPSLSLERDRYPDRALAFVKETSPRGPMLNEFALGGFLIWHLPEHRVFIDGRNDILYPSSFVGDYVRGLRDPERFRVLTEKWAIEWLVLQNFPDEGTRAFIDHGSGFVPVHFSQGAVIYVREHGENEELAHRFAYRVLRPYQLTLSIVEAAADPALHEPALAEARRMVEGDPDGEFAHIALAKLYVALGPRFATQADAELEWSRGRGMDL